MACAASNLQNSKTMAHQSLVWRVGDLAVPPMGPWVAPESETKGWHPLAPSPAHPCLRCGVIDVSGGDFVGQRVASGGTTPSMGCFDGALDAPGPRIYNL